ncbi:hypothetical protein VPH35_104520 [Triticum aestivum]
MKDQADKHRIEHTFVVGESVFLKLQPYLQSSVAPRANHKLAFKYYGPFKIVARVGEVAYQLDLPISSRVHPVFHVSLLKRVLAPDCQVRPHLLPLDTHLQVPEQVLRQRVVRKGNDSAVQVLIRWSDSTDELATWEDKDTLKQLFPRASAWGQAVSKGGGVVSDQEHIEEHVTRETEVQITTRPRRKPQQPARLARPEWAT